jgi:hypothetical protein
MHRHSEKGMVTTISKMDKAVSMNAVNPGPSGSSEENKNQ